MSRVRTLLFEQNKKLDKLVFGGLFCFYHFKVDINA